MKSGDWGLGTRGWGPAIWDWRFGTGGWGSGNWRAGVRRVVAASLFITACTTLFAQTPAADEPERRPKMTVCVYNYAQVSSHLLAAAEEEVTRIYLQAGVEVVWMLAPLKGTAEEHQAASQIDSPRWNYLLNLTTRAKAAKLPSSLDPLGFAMPCAAEDAICRAYIFSDRIEEMAKEQSASEARILAHVMAHELGHLVLGPRCHSREGIMQGIWQSKAIARASRGILLFTAGQAEVIRVAIGRRNTSHHEVATVSEAPR